MEFFDKLGKKASEVYKTTADKTGKIAKDTKIKLKMGELKSEVSDLYKEIGKKVYENHVRESEEDKIKNEIEELCTKIDVINDEIEGLLQESLELNDKKQCPNCYTNLDKKDKFCNVCGQKQEEKEEPAKEVEVVEKSENPEQKEPKSEESQTADSNEVETNLEKTVEVESAPKINEGETQEHIKIEEE